jgi:putative restriction endonuclease
VPLAQLQAGFEFEGERVSFGSFQKGIPRARVQRGPPALTLTTSLKDSYGDAYDEGGALFTYAYRAGAFDRADNRARRAALSCVRTGTGAPSACASVPSSTCTHRP